MTTLHKADAVAALLATDGDLRLMPLRDAGLYEHKAILLGRVLESHELCDRGPGGCRILRVDLEQAIACIEEMADPLELPTFTITHVPERDRPNPFVRVGDVLTRENVVELLRIYRAAFNGVELRRNGYTYRLYQGNLYRLDDERMIETAV
jgi:hypothetical protein